MFEGLARVPGDQEEAPVDLTCLGIVGGDITPAMTGFRTSLADVDLPGRAPWSPGDVEASQSCRNPGIHIPNFFAGRYIDGY